jgi:ArsR family transcriptional regulator
MLSDGNRLRIINIIKDSALCVGEIQTLLATQQSNTSRHLDKLKSNQIISYYKDAQKVFYFLNKDILEEYKFLEDLLYVDLSKTNCSKFDLDRLTRYKNSELNCDDLRAVNFDFDKLEI